MNGRTELFGWVILAGATLSLGCASRTNMQGPARVSCPEGVTTAQVVEAAHDVLTDMHFALEKLDVEQGIVRTWPLRAGQFFEFWRSDNVGAFNVAEANVQSVRRTVELRTGTEATDSADRWIECTVQVQRLALPANEIAGLSHAYQIHTQSTAALQRLDVTPQQREGMAWIDLGTDPQLTAEVLRRIVRRLERRNL